MPNPYQRKARVAIITTSYPARPGDWAGHFVREEARELVREGAAVTVITPRAAAVDEGIHVRSLGGSSAFGPPGALERIAAFPPRALPAALWAARASHVLRHERYDRVIAHWAVPSAWPISMGGCQAALEVVSHGSDVRLIASMPAFLRAYVVSAIVERAAVWRFVSGDLLELLACSLDHGLAARVRARAVVVPPSLHLPDVGVRARALRAELGAFQVSVGRLIASKRVDKAIEHAAATRSLLVVVGEGPARRSLERHAARTSARVRFVGDLPRDEALAYIAAADSLVFTSEAEGFSTVIREAAAHDTRVVRT